MSKPFPLWILAALGLMLLGTNAFALAYHLFFYHPWLDIPMHVVAGLWVSLMALAYYYSARVAEPKSRSDPAVLRIAVLSALSVGVAWELFEFSLDHIALFGIHGMQDTLNDILNDIIGAVFAAQIFATERFNRLVPAPDPLLPHDE